MKKIILCLSAAVALLSVSACTDSNKLANPPSLNIEVAGQTEPDKPAKLATYNWNGEMAYGGPWEAAESENAIVVTPSSTVSLIFEKEPEKLNVREHTSSYEFVEVEEDANAFKVPAQPGEYIYGIEGDWKEGSAVYGIKVKVE